MDHIVAGQVVGPRDLDLSRGLLTSLLRHQLGAVQPQLNAGIGVDAVVDAGVAGDVAAGHPAVGGVDDSAAP